LARKITAQTGKISEKVLLKLKGISLITIAVDHQKILRYYLLLIHA